MSTNQSFIKAFRQDGADPFPSGRPARRVAAPAARGEPVLAGDARDCAAQLDAIGSTVAYVSPAFPLNLDDADPIAPVASLAVNTPITSRHAAPERIVTESFPIVEPRPTERTATLRADGPASMVKRPLSSYSRRGTAAAPVPMSLRPGTTIASFQWPAACRKLLACHGQSLDRVIELLLAHAGQGRTMFGVLGLFRGAGCSTTALCLAARTAGRGRRIVAVDGHFQAPQFASALDARPTAWWQDVLDERALLADALIRAEDDRLDVLPLGLNPPGPSTRQRIWTNGLQLAATAGALRHAYDLVLVDLGAFFDPLSQPPALALIEHMRIQGVIAVTSPDRNDVRDLETVTEHLADRDCDLLGTIENRAEN
jgi:Mrp family chromosome partitioning ATPase